MKFLSREIRRQVQWCPSVSGSGAGGMAILAAQGVSSRVIGSYSPFQLGAEMRPENSSLPSGWRSSILRNLYPDDKGDQPIPGARPAPFVETGRYHRATALSSSTTIHRPRIPWCL